MYNLLQKVTEGGTNLLFILSCLVSGMVGAFGMAICAAGSYEKGYKDAKKGL